MQCAGIGESGCVPVLINATGGNPGWCLRVLLAVLLMSGCSDSSTSHSADSAEATVTGTVSYRERIALPPDAAVIVKLVDVSIADAPAKVLAAQTIERPGQVPIAFTLVYNPGDIDPRYRYAVQARVELGERLLFITDRHYPVITHGAGNDVELILVRVK